MKPLPFVFGLFGLFGFSACDRHDHGHSHGPGGHSHGPDGHSHETPASGEKAAEHGHEHEDGHSHEGIVVGPNGGRVLTIVEPHAEFFVTPERKVRITFVTDDLKVVPVAEQSVDIIAGDRLDPTVLAFQKSGSGLISDKALPEGNLFPVVVTIKTTPGAVSARDKFNLNLSDCPTCDNKEYACTCEHEH